MCPYVIPLLCRCDNSFSVVRICTFDRCVTSGLGNGEIGASLVAVYRLVDPAECSSGVRCECILNVFLYFSVLCVTLFCCPLHSTGNVDVETSIKRALHPAEGGAMVSSDEAIPQILSCLLSVSIASSGLYVILEKWLDTCGSVEVLHCATSPDGADISEKVSVHNVMLYQRVC